MIRIILCILCFMTLLRAEDPSVSLEESTSASTHTIEVQGRSLTYTATAGTLLLRNEQGAPEASIFYVAYHLENLEDKGQKKRPVTFCFNGGPGSASIWLHMGAFGPMKIDLPDTQMIPPPYSYKVNPYTLLDVTDLVFVDPVSTGYSRAAPGVSANHFHGVIQDISSLGRFVALYTTRNGLWEAPKFLMGESYGTFRVAALAAHLHDVHALYLNGLIFISMVLDFGTILDSNCSNDLPYLLALPSYTAAAHYHNKIRGDRDTLIKAAERFAMGEYNMALFRGDELSLADQRQVADTLASFTGLSTEEILRRRLRIPPNFFARELLKEQARVLGHWDARYLGIDTRLGRESRFSTLDPTAEALMGPFTSVAHSYLSNELYWKSNQSYNVLADIGWNYEPYVNQYATSGHQLASTMAKNPNLRLFVASGYYDIVTPYFAAKYTLSHLGLNPALFSHIDTHNYEAGHMMYLHPPSLKALKDDLSAFYHKTLGGS